MAYVPGKGGSAGMGPGPRRPGRRSGMEDVDLDAFEPILCPDIAGNRSRPRRSARIKEGLNAMGAPGYRKALVAKECC